jgi:hypothetical protein
MTNLVRAAFASTSDCAKKLLNTGTSLSSPWLLATVSTKPIAAMGFGHLFLDDLGQPLNDLDQLGEPNSCLLPSRWAPGIEH